MLTVFLERAEQLSRARDLIRADEPYAAALALLSVHSAIAMSDALLLKLSGSRGKGSNHLAAVSAVEQACKANRLSAAGIRQLQLLLSKKTVISYGNAAVSFETASVLATASERFQHWAYKTMEGLA